VRGWLGIDGALGTFSAAYVDGDTVRAAEGAGNDALERGLALIDEALAGQPLHDLAGIAVVTGPGRFTGLRIALSYAKALAFAARLPLVGISAYDACEPLELAPEPHATFVSGRAGPACVRLATPRGPFETCGTHAELARRVAAEAVPGGYLGYGVAAKGAAPTLGELGIIVHPVAPLELPAVVAARRAAAGAPAGPAHALRADYGEAHYAERTGDAASR